MRAIFPLSTWRSRNPRQVKGLTATAAVMVVIIACIVQLAGCRQDSSTTVGVAVTSVSWEPRSPKVGQSVAFRAVLRNATHETIPSGTPIQVNVGVDGTQVASTNIETATLPPGSTLAVSASHVESNDGMWTATAGRHFVVGSANITPSTGPVIHSLMRKSALMVIRPVPKQKAIAIMPLGDSITSGNHSATSYRYYLWKRLAAGGIHDVDFVGSLHGITDGFTPLDNDWDDNHEGHSGWRADEVLIGRQNGKDELAGTLGGRSGWANIYRPDIVLVDLGANDLEQGRTPEAAMASVARVIDTLRTVNPRVCIALAQLSPDSDADNAALLKFNELVARYALDNTETDSPIIPVDLYTNIDKTSDLVDGVHLTDNGNSKLADQWYPAVVKLIKVVESRPKRTTQELEALDGHDEP